MWIKRSEYIKSKMIQPGIEAERLIITEHSNCLFNPTKEQLDNAKNKQEKDELYKNARHVSFSVLRKNYISPKTIRIKKE